MQEAMDTIIGFLDGGGAFERIQGEDGTLRIKFTNGEASLILTVNDIEDESIKTATE